MYYRITNQAENNLFKALRKQTRRENKKTAAGSYRTKATVAGGMSYLIITKLCR
jgi:hypothetical protein